MIAVQNVGKELPSWKENTPSELLCHFDDIIASRKSYARTLL